MQLSIVIVNYNVRAFLENCLHSVKKAMSGIDAEIFVVDNASDDGSVEMVKEKFPDVNLIANDKNLGFAAANNIALRKSSGEYLLLLNPDTILQENTLSVMMEFLDKNDSVGLAGCKILNPDGTLQLACRRSFPTPWVAFTKIIGLSALFPRTRLFGKYNLEYLDPDKSYEVDAVSGSFMFVRRKAYEQIGKLDEQYFMYGEDLDWCYRIKKSGWKIYYVSETKVIHYKGESVRRSDIDEVKLFYEAMRLFVGKHFSKGIISDWFLRIGIAIRESVASISKIIRQLKAVILDVLFVNVSLFLAEYIWFGKMFHFPAYAYPVIVVFPPLVVLSSMYFFGVYTKRKLSITHAFGSVIFGYLILSALTFFFKQYGFSRMVVAISGILNFFLLPGWRLIARSIFKSFGQHQPSLFGRRTLIVGIGKSGQELLRKLRSRVTDGYEIIGFVDLTRKTIGEKIAGVEILGSIDNIGKVIEENKASEVIFSSDSLPYTDILTVIGRSGNRSVNFRLVPNSMDVIIGKTHIDELNDMPLVDIDYNINHTTNKIIKRLFDLFVAAILMVFIYPFVILKSKDRSGNFNKSILALPDVLSGKLSIVGLADLNLSTDKNRSRYFGKKGITGLVQINYRDDLTQEEVEKYNLYYAKNHSLILDLEILIKTIIMFIRKEDANA